MNNIKNVKPKAHQWLLDQGVSKWTLVHDCGMCYETITTNEFECFHGVLKHARRLSIKTLIIIIYYNLIIILLK